MVLLALPVAGGLFPAFPSIPQARAETAFQLEPFTKLRLKVVEWEVAKGEYREWLAVGGEFTVSQARTISVPLVGVVDTTGLDADGLADDIAKRLQARTGLIDLPDATIEIIDFPPVYVVGSVDQPGEYKYRPNLTALQALSLAGGRYRLREDGRTQDEIRYLGELETTRRDMQRTVARVARLQAEMNNKETIDFPVEIKGNASDPEIGKLIQEETEIFDAREEAIRRQLETLAELRDLFDGEIKVLEEKIVTQDRQVKSVEDELNSVIPLVERGIATQSRQSELERGLSSLQSERLDLITATMRARQNLSEAARESASLRGQRRTTVSQELQESQAQIEKLLVQQEITQRLLLAAGASVSREMIEQGMQESDLILTVVRAEGDGTVELPATEATLMRPGDVLKAAVNGNFGTPQTAPVATPAPNAPPSSLPAAGATDGDLTTGALPTPSSDGAAAVAETVAR